MCVFEIIYLKSKNNRQLIVNLNKHNYKNKKMDRFGLIKYSITRHCYKKQMDSSGITMYDVHNFIPFSVLLCSEKFA